MSHHQETGVSLDYCRLLYNEKALNYFKATATLTSQEYCQISTQTMPLSYFAHRFSTSTTNRLEEVEVHLPTKDQSSS